MADDKKISQLTAAGALTGSETIEVVQGGVNKQTTTQDIANLGGGGSGTVESVTGTGVDNTDPDNPEIVLPHGLSPVSTTGTAVAFAIPQIYGSVASPETGNITLVTTGLVVGMIQKMYHDNGTEPTYPAEFVRMGQGTYSTAVLNVIYMEAVSASRIEYWIDQEQ